jgi:DHA1 family solute carrier family 18 vesicular amine transporter 1/2
VGVVDAALVPFLANLVDKKGSNQYGPVYALQQVFVSLAYAFGPLLGGQAVHVFGFPWLMRIIGFLNLMFSPLLLELEKVNYYKREHGIKAGCIYLSIIKIVL